MLATKQVKQNKTAATVWTNFHTGNMLLFVWELKKKHTRTTTKKKKMGKERHSAKRKIPSPAQANVPAAPECPGAPLSIRQLIIRCLFRAADSASLSRTSNWSRLFVGKCLRSALGPADIFSCFLNCLSVSRTRVNSQIVVVLALPDLPGGVQITKGAALLC